MTRPNEHVDDILSEWLEGDLDLPQRRAVDAHLRECLRCASIVRDIDGIRRDAANLPEIAPSRDLWDGIAARIETPVIEITRQATPATPRRTWQMAAAAVVLMAVSSGITYLVATGGGGLAGSGVAAGDTNAVGTPANVIVPSRPASGGATLLVRAEPMAAEVVYAQEISRLRIILDERRGTLDTATVNTVEKSLIAIDNAIADARRALAGDASSQFLTEQLNRALEKKLGVLRRVALLPVGAS